MQALVHRHDPQMLGTSGASLMVERRYNGGQGRLRGACDRRRVSCSTLRQRRKNRKRKSRREKGSERREDRR